VSGADAPPAGDPQADAAAALTALRARAGRELEPGPWLEVTQAMVDAFAALTGDDQYIHVDPARAAGTMFGGTVAHGYLTLGLLPRLTPARDALLAGLGGRMRVNYGLNRVRFPAPVPVGRRIRARTVLLAAEPVPTGTAVQVTWGYTVEVEAGERPAMVAEALTRIYF
jgi:acyl dehydratase